MDSKHINKWNYKIFLLANFIGYFAGGLIGPFYTLFLQKIGGSIEAFGIAIGLMILAGSITSYFVGRYSDKFGRKFFLVISGFLSSIILIAYTFVSSLPQLFILQIINGVNGAIWGTVETIFLGDITKKVTRGIQIGKYNMIVGTAMALAIMVGGLLVGKFGFSPMFYIAATIIFLSTSLLFLIKEQN